MQIAFLTIALAFSATTFLFPTNSTAQEDIESLITGCQDTSPGNDGENFAGLRNIFSDVRSSSPSIGFFT
jgi:hypothetical protein